MKKRASFCLLVLLACRIVCTYIGRHFLSRNNDKCIELGKL